MYFSFSFSISVFFMSFPPLHFGLFFFEHFFSSLLKISLQTVVFSFKTCSSYYLNNICFPLSLRLCKYPFHFFFALIFFILSFPLKSLSKISFPTWPSPTIFPEQTVAAALLDIISHFFPIYIFIPPWCISIYYLGIFSYVHAKLWFSSVYRYIYIKYWGN